MNLRISQDGKEEVEFDVNAPLTVFPGGGDCIRWIAVEPVGMELCMTIRPVNGVGWFVSHCPPGDIEVRLYESDDFAEQAFTEYGDIKDDDVLGRSW